MSTPLIVDQTEFEDLCLEIRRAGEVAFDTEFISDDSYQPRLFLLQFAFRDRCVAVDPLRVDDLGSWWSIMADRRTTVVTHAGREEVRFCLRESGLVPHRLVDIQIAEGLRSRAYPLSCENLVARVLGRRLRGTETRSDWSRRPLSAQQVTYALDDVRYLLPIWHRQRADLARRDRLDWAESEFERMVDEVQRERDGAIWRRVPGLHRLDPRELAVARELIRWRDQKAAELDRPVRRILRDDLIIELARRRPKTPKEVLATRGLKRSAFRKSIDEIIRCIERGEEVPEESLPAPQTRRSPADQEQTLSRLLALALADQCERHQVAMALVGKGDDLVDFIRWFAAGCPDTARPRLCQGWRAEVCGDLLADVLRGRIRLRVGDLRSSRPLVFEPVGNDAQP
ncbi:MAG TPA: ribonuclease D [Planctomycetaceae bacterium]|nr:ribonuclease D [Planctomycetaceae bacterium]